MNPQRTELPVLLGWMFCLSGVLFASSVATGGEIPRLAFLIVPLFLGTFLCALSRRFIQEPWIFWTILIAAGYFLARGVASPVWDLARRDLFLIVSGLLAFLSASIALREKSSRYLFLSCILLLVFANAAVSFHQWQHDREFAFLRGDRADTAGLSGFYYHRNYFAGWLEIACPILLGAIFGFKQAFFRAFLCLGLLLAFVLCFSSNSRGGFAVTVLACFVTLVSEVSRSRAEPHTQGKFKFGRVGFGVASALLLLFAGRYLWLIVIENRGGGGDAENTLEARLTLAGIAFDIWLQSPIWGNGSQSFSYLFPRLFAGFGSWIGDAEMVHSDYLQVLVDYGLIGFCVLIFLLGMIGYLILKPLSEQTLGSLSFYDDGLWMRSAARGALVAECIRAAFDFNLHIAPNLILFSMILGGGVSCGSKYFLVQKTNQPTTRSPQQKLTLVSVFTILLLGVYGLSAGSKEILAFGKWIELEKRQQTGEGDVQATRILADAAPSFPILKSLARQSLFDAINSGGDPATNFEVTAEDWSRVIERHPLDGESLANYARSLDELGEFKKSEPFHQRAIEAVGRRENKYGVIYGVGWHYLRRGDEAMKSRRPGEALFFFQKANEAFEASRKRKFAKTSYSQVAAERSSKLIKFLEEARIEPEAVPILDWRSHLD